MWRVGTRAYGCPNPDHSDDEQGRGCRGMSYTIKWQKAREARNVRPVLAHVSKW